MSIFLPRLFAVFLRNGCKKRIPRPTAQKIQHQPLVLLPEICYTNMVCLDRCARLARPGRFIIRRIHLEKLTYTHNDAAAKVLAAYYETPPLAYVRSYGCPCSRV